MAMNERCPEGEPLGMSQRPDARRLAGTIDAIAADRRPVEGPESAALATALDQLRDAIVAGLVPREPAVGLALLDRFLRLDSPVLARAEDGDGVIGDVFRQATADCGRAWEAVPDRDPRQLAETVFALFVEDEHGLRGDLVPAFSGALGSAGLDALEGLIRHRLGDLSGTPTGPEEADLVRVLIEIADARGDLDGFIALHEHAGTEIDAVTGICERLASVGRLDEALGRVQRATVPEWRRAELDRLRIGLLDRLGRGGEARALRRALFTRTLSPAILDELLAVLPAAERADALAEAVADALSHADAHGALEILIRHSPDAAATLVRRRVGELNPRLYRVLRPAAEQLAARDPLAAALLRRRLADGVLDQGLEAAYGYAISDLAAAIRLSADVADWAGHPTAEEYRRQVTTTHRSKRGFWERLRQAGIDWSA